MLLQLEDTGQEAIQKLMRFAEQNHLHLSLLDENENFYLPGNPLSASQLNELIDKGRKSGTISMEEAHKTIRNKFDGD